MDPDPRVHTTVSRSDPDSAVFFGDFHDANKKHRKFFPEFFLLVADRRGAVGSRVPTLCTAGGGGV
jgi:hypothetical protein